MLLLVFILLGLLDIDEADLMIVGLWEWLWLTSEYWPFYYYLVVSY